MHRAFQKYHSDDNQACDGGALANQVGPRIIEFAVILNQSAKITPLLTRLVKEDAHISRLALYHPRTRLSQQRNCYGSLKYQTSL
jgi:hypothetical protein